MGNEWIPQSGDRIKEKGTIKPIYVLCSKTDLGFRFVEEREIGIAGGELNFLNIFIILSLSSLFSLSVISLLL